MNSSTIVTYPGTLSSFNNLNSANKKDLFMKKVLAIDTYVLYTRDHYLVLATIAHNRTESGVEEICREILDEVVADECGCFIMQYI